jgi:uncharacterized protein with FMN-binding domain
LAPVKNNLVALGSAAVVAVYAAGYAKTREAAAQFVDEARDRPPLHPAQHDAVLPEAPAPKTPDISAPAPKLEKAAPADSSEPKKVAAKPKKADTATKVSKTEPPVAVSPVLPPPVAAPPVVAAATTPPPVPPKDTATKAAAAPDTAAKSDKNAPLKDGMFIGWGSSRHGDIQATVMVKEGKIVGAVISECLTQYSCSWISMLPQQVIDRQSAEVDFVSGATQSTYAFYYAVVNALKKAK